MEFSKATSAVDLFKGHGDLKQAAQMSKYVRNKFTYLGIATPTRKSLSKSWINEISKNAPDINHDFIKLLWSMPEREYQYLAIEVLLKMVKKLKPADIDLLEHLMTTKPWWDTVDILSTNLVSSLVRKHPDIIRSHIYPWAFKKIPVPSMWLQRASILCQSKHKHDTNTQILEDVILANKDTDEFFLNKAIGWSLREYAKTNKQWVLTFLKTNKFNSLSVREATKHIRKAI